MTSPPGDYKEPGEVMSGGRRAAMQKMFYKRRLGTEQARNRHECGKNGVNFGDKNRNSGKRQ
jgi:hypothetical protein